MQECPAISGVLRLRGTTQEHHPGAVAEPANHIALMVGKLMVADKQCHPLIDVDYSRRFAFYVARIMQQLANN